MRELLNIFIELWIPIADYKHRKRVKKEEESEGRKKPLKKHLLSPSILLFITAFGIAFLASIVFRYFVFPTKTKNEIVQIEQAINKWEQHYNHFPRNLEQIILNKPVRSHWNKDSWNRNYKYSVDTVNNTFSIVSAGRDGVFDTHDDIKIDD